MRRRQFLGASAAVTAALLGGEATASLRRNLGVGTAGAASVDAVPPRAETVRGRVADVEGADLTVDLSAPPSAGPVTLLAVRRGYPDGAVLAQVETDPVALPGPAGSVTVQVPAGDSDADRWFYEVFVEEDGELAYLCESAPHRWRRRPEYGAEPASRVTDGPGPADRSRFVRERVDNDYALRFRWWDSRDRTWQLRYRVRRSVHEAAVARDRGYVRTFEESASSPVARDLAAALRSDAVTLTTDDEPEAGPDLSDAEWFDLLVRFVQGVRYARDEASMGQYDYNRTVEETLVAGVGDCKDKTHLLAGLLSADPLDCDTAMLFQPAHVLLGVAAADVPEPYADRETVTLGGREYLPVDGSLRFDVGDYPDAQITAAYGDGEWLHYDVGAIGRGLDRNLRDLVEQNT